MVRERFEVLTRGNVLQIGLALFLLGAIGYGGFRFIGFESASAGIAAESILLLLVLAWTGSYLFRVVTGKMTFVEQRKRYLDAYEKLSTKEIQSRFESMTEEEQIRLIKEIESE